MHDFETFLILVAMILPIAIIPMMITGIVIVTIYKAVKGDFIYVSDDHKEIATESVRQDSIPRGRPNVRHDGNRWLFAVRDYYRRFGVWARKDRTKKSNA